MAKNTRIKTADEDGSNEEIVELVFEDQDWDTLEDFARYATELETNSLIREGIPSSLNVNWTANEGLKIDAKIPPDEQIDAMLMRLRPFLLENERTYFHHVRNIIGKATNNQRVRRHLEALDFFYSGRHLQSHFVAGVSSNEYPEGKIVNSEPMLQLWLNGYRFHREKEKAKIFDAMHEIMPIESSVALFLLLITDKITAIVGLQQLVSLLAGKETEIYVPLMVKEPLHYIVYLHPNFAMFNFLDLDEQEQRPLPEQGEPFATRVFDLTSLGPLTLFQFINLAGEFWLKGEMVAEIGKLHYWFRVAKGFRNMGGEISRYGTDIIVTVTVQGLLTEALFSFARRKPAQATLDRMLRNRQGDTKIVLRSFDTKEALNEVLNQDPKPEVTWITVPRVAFECAYWPLSRQADERLHNIIAKGRRPTFEEIEGDVSKAWEIFEDGGDPLEEESQRSPAVPES